MNQNFDSLFGRLPPSLIRSDDGTIRADPSHPMVQKLVEAIWVCREAGDSEEEILAIVQRGVAKGLKRLEATDGPHPQH
jgi:hypothetical protein